MNKQAQAVVLFLVGAALLWASLTGVYLRYVKAGLRPLLIGAGIVLIVAAVATIWYELRPRLSARQKAADHEHQEHGEHQEHQEDEHHGHTHREPRVAWLLVLPLIALILISPPALGSYAASRAGTALQPPLGFPPLVAGDPLPMTVVDYAERAVYDHGHSLQGRRVEITGFISTGEPGGAPILTRMFFACCAADAAPIKVGLAGQVPAGLHADTWLQVVGTFTDRQIKDVINGGPIPFIEVSQATPVPVPRDPYEV